MPLFLIRYLPYIIGALAIIGACWVVVLYAIHENGRSVERAEWLEKEKTQQEAQAKALGEAMQRVADQSERNQQNTMEVLDAKDRAINKLQNDMRAQRTASGLWITAEACGDGGAMPGKTESPGQPRDAKPVRLPEDVERRLRDLAETAQRVAIDHNACVAELAQLVVVVADH